MAGGFDPWPVVYQGPKPSIFDDPANPGHPRRDPANGNRPYNIINWTILEYYGTTHPAKDAKSDKIMNRFLGSPSTGFTNLDAAGIINQAADQYKPIASGPNAGKYQYASGVGLGGRGRATIFWKEPLDPGTTHPQPVVIEGLPPIDEQQRQMRSVPLPDAAFPAVSPAPQIHGAVGNDQTLCFYDPDTDVMWEMEKTQRAMHFPQRHGTLATGIIVEDGGHFAAGSYCWKVTTLVVRPDGQIGESDAKPKNQFDDSNFTPPRGILVKAGQKVTLRWESPPAVTGATVPHGWRIYRSPPTGTDPNSNCLLIDEITYDPATAGSFAEYLDDGSFVPPSTAKKAPISTSTNLNTAWTSEMRVSTPVGVLHEASKCRGHYEDRTDSIGHTERFYWGPAATKIPIPAGILTEYEIRVFAGLRDTWLNATGTAKTAARAALDAYVFPHALSIAAPKGLSSVTNFGYPAQAADGKNGSSDALLQGARFLLDPDFDWRSMDARCQALKDLNTAPSTAGSGGPGATSVFLDKCSEFVKCIVRTMQVHGFFIHDSGVDSFSFYTESPDLALGRDTADPYYGDWTQLFIGDHEVANVFNSSAAVMAIKKQIRRTQELGAIPWSQVYLPPVTRCSLSGGGLTFCAFGGQTSTDTPFDIGDAVYGDNYLDTNGTDLGEHSAIDQDGNPNPWDESRHPAIVGSIILSGGKTIAPIIPALYFLTRPMPSPDFSMLSEFRAYDTFDSVTNGGAFLFEHVHRLASIDRRHYIGVGFNSAAGGFSVRQYLQPTTADVALSQSLGTFPYVLTADPDTPRFFESFVAGDEILMVLDGALLPFSVPIPAGYTTSTAGLNIAYPQGDADGVQLDNLWVYDRSMPTPPGRIRRVVRATIGGTSKIIDLLGGV